MSKKLSKSILAALLISSPPRTTIPAAEPTIVGQVVGSRGASLGGIPVPGASTISQAMCWQPIIRAARW